MAKKVTVYDTRLEGRTPLGSTSFISLKVNEGLPLNEFFDQIQFIAQQNNGISTLFLMTQIVTSGLGGAGDAGLLFCKEGVHVDNVQQFARLIGWVDHIVIFQCADAPNEFDVEHADVIHPELSKTFHGDGDDVCKSIAVYSGIKVTVVRESLAYVANENLTTYSGYELYCESGAIDYSDWEGSVISFDENGNILDEITNPMSWRDSHGLIHDPRLEPEP
jgi:hypothetical protein